MSYDLYLTSPRLNEDAFNQYFSRRPNYAQPGRYANDATGIYFQFEFHNPKPGNEPLGGEFVAFNLNYYRPHTFGLEAEPEVSAFVNAFGCVIRDPQLDGMAEGPYSAAGFLRGWNKGNAFAYGAVSAQDGLNNMLLADETRIEHAWRWNLGLKARQAGFGESHFLPRAIWGKRLSDGAPIAFAVWGEGVLTAFPDCVTHVLVMRKRRADSGSASGEKKEVMESKLVSIEDVASLQGCEWRESGGEKLLLAPVDAQPSQQIISMFAGQFSEPKAVMQFYSPDHVLDASLMAEARKAREK